jgi:hypothetical protein
MPLTRREKYWHDGIIEEVVGRRRGNMPSLPGRGEDLTGHLDCASKPCGRAIAKTRWLAHQTQSVVSKQRLSLLSRSPKTNRLSRVSLRSAAVESAARDLLQQSRSHTMVIG